MTFRTGPYSAGTVNTSPRASNTARLPVGETDARAMSASPPSALRGFSVDPIGHHLHVHFARLLGLQIEQVQPAAGLKDDVVGAERGIRDVEVAKCVTCRSAFVFDVERPDVLALVAAAIGQEVERVPVPHRVFVVGRVVRDVARRERLAD